MRKIAKTKKISKLILEAIYYMSKTLVCIENYEIIIPRKTTFQTNIF
jgi:hypothetical protein